MKMYCPNCGKENSDGNRFCSNCGTKLVVTTQDFSDIERQDLSDMESIETASDSKKGFFQKTAGKLLLVIIIVAAAVAVVITVMWVRSGHRFNETENIEDEATLVIGEDEDAESVTADVYYDPDSLSEECQNMLGPMDSVAYALNAGASEFTYDWHDDEYVWEAIFCLINNYRYDLSEETDEVTLGSDVIYVTEDFLKECASAMFADFDGQLPASGMGNIEKEGDLYKFRIGDRGDEYACISSWIDHMDGTCTVETQIGIASTGELAQTFRFELVKNKYTESEEDPVYVYSVASVENIYNGVVSSYSETITSDEYYILPESDVRYYSEDELSALTKDELRLARNEIYARHGRKFDSEDLQSYFESQSWYHGTIAPSDFSESMLNEYEKENIKTIQELEDDTAQAGMTDQAAQVVNNNDGLFEPSWEAIKNYGLINGDWLYHDYSSGKYTYSDLSFDLYLDTLTDMGDYYYVEAVFNKPVIVSSALNDDERYNVIIDELAQTSAALSAMEANNSFGYVMGADGEKCTMYDADDIEMFEVYYDSDDRLDEPFYRGVLRISKDAVTGASITYGPYKTVDIAVLRAGYGWYNGVAFDENGYVTQLLSLGD